MDFLIYSDPEESPQPPQPIIPAETVDHQVNPPSVIVEAYEINDFGDSVYRVSIDSQVRIITIQPDVNLSQRIISSDILPTPIPAGDWNFGVIRKCPWTLKDVWTTSLDAWPSCRVVWHAVTIDLRDLTTVMRLRPNVHVVRCPRYPGLDLIYKFATFPHRTPLIEHESSVYKIISEASASASERANPDPR